VVAVPKVAKPLSDEEKALYAILQDDSGLDFFEFAVTSGNSDTKVSRAYRYQWLWWLDDSKYQIHACSRDVGKSFGIINQALAWPFAHPGHDLFITAPSLDHLKPLARNIEEALMANRLTREMLKSSHGKTGISQIPSFEAVFKNAAKIVTRLPKQDGRGLKGQHALRVIGDEQQDSPDPEGFNELFPTLRSELPDAQLRLYGVTNGLGGTFDNFANDAESLFKLWRIIAPQRPTWDEESRHAKIKQYKGETTFDYTRNIFGEGLGGSGENFVAARLIGQMRIAESDWAMEYNRIYKRNEIDAATMLMRKKQHPIEELDFSDEVFDPQYSSYWMGADLGLTNDPTELLIFGYTESTGSGLYRLLHRISMSQIPSNLQIELFCHVLTLFGDRVVRFALDKTGLGLPMYESLISLGPWYQQRVRGYHFSNKVVAGFEDRKREPKEKLKDLELTENVKTLGLLALRELVDQKKLELPNDPQLIASWLGIDEDDDHVLDAGRMFGAAVNLHRVDAIMDALKPKRVKRRWGG
jgi:hypothetical protein